MHKDEDLIHLPKIDLIEEVMRLRQGIRYCRDESGDQLCWLDLEKLYELLPETKLIPKTLPPKEVFLRNCEAFHTCRSKLEHKSIDELYKDWETDKPY